VIHDVRTVRVEKQLGSALMLIRRARQEAEAWSDQTLADDLTELEMHLQAIHHAVDIRGRRYGAANVRSLIGS
jgi:hypothetical protein